MVEKAQMSKSKNQNLADRVGFSLTIIALTVGFTIFFVWFMITDDFTFIF